MNRFLRWLLGPAVVNHVGMFNTAAPTCMYCGGTGWYPDHQDRCLSRCSCVAPSDRETGNE